MVFCLGGIYAAQGPDDFASNHCWVNIFAQCIHCKWKRVELIFRDSQHLHQDGIQESLLTWSHFGNLFSTDFVSLPLRGQVLHSVPQFQTVQVSTHLTEEISDPTDLKALKFIKPIRSYYKKRLHKPDFYATQDTLPVVKENLLIVICSLNETKIVLQCGDKSMNLLGDCAVEEPNGHSALLARAFHLTDRKLHLKRQQYLYRTRGLKAFLT